VSRERTPAEEYNYWTRWLNFLAEKEIVSAWHRECRTPQQLAEHYADEYAVFVALERMVRK